MSTKSNSVLVFYPRTLWLNTECRNVWINVLLAHGSMHTFKSPPEATLRLVR